METEEFIDKEKSATTITKQKIDPDKVIKTEPRMVKENFENAKMDKLVLLIKMPKGTTLEDANRIAHSNHKGIVHYVSIADVEHMEVEVSHILKREISILWGLFKWTY